MREIAMAAAFGTGIAADSFIVAWRFPNLFQFIFGENSFTAAFLPKFTEIRHNEGSESAFAMASAILTALFLILIAVCVLGIIYAPYIIEFIAIGWKDEPLRMQLSTKLVRVLFAFVGFLGLGSYCQAILNTYRRFFISSVAPAFTNFAWLAGIGLAILLFSDQAQQIKFVAGSIVVGSFLAFLWQFIWVLKIGWRFSWAIKGRIRDVFEVGLLLLPSLLALASHEINYLADIMLASLLPGGSVSSLAYGSRLLYLPLSLLGYSITTASLPTLSDAAACGADEDFAKTLSTTVRSVFTILAPIALVTIVLRYEIVSLLFERGRFGATTSTPMVMVALLFYIIGLPFHGVTRALQQAFYAKKDTRTPVYISGIGVILNIEISMILMFYLAHGGLALGSALTGLIVSTMLIFHMKKRVPLFSVKSLLVNELLVATAGGVSAVVTWLLKDWLNPQIALGAQFPTKLAQMLIPAAFFFAVFFAVSRVMGIRDVETAWRKAFAKLSARFRNRP